MHFTKDQLDQMQNAIDTAPKYSAPARRLLAKKSSSPTGSVSLLPYLPYIPSQRDQGNCGNCWVWASNGALEIEHNVNNGIRDRLSIQYVNSKYEYNTGSYACLGGNVEKFTTWYNTDKSPIPWTNTNASYGDYKPKAGGATAVPFSSITTSPHYSLNSLTNTTVSTYGVGNATAIANIKAALDSNHPVVNLYYLPSAGWTDFSEFWNSGTNTSMYDTTVYNGQEIGGGHAVLIVGYNTTDPVNPYWLVLNSWGATTNRTDGTYRLNMSMNYDAVAYESGETYQQNQFEILTSDFTGTPAMPTVSSVSPGSGPVTGGNLVTITGIGFTGATNVTFGSTAATSFTNVPADTDSQITAIAPAGTAGTVHVTVTTSYGTSTTTTADQYTYTAAPTTSTTTAPLPGGESDNGPAAVPAVQPSSTTEVNVGGNSAVSRVGVTGTGISELIVTGTEQSSPGAGVSPAPGSIYEYISLVPARYTTITGATITFTIPASWLEEHDRSPQDIVMYHYTGTGWTALPTTIGTPIQGQVTCTATSPSFSLYAISAMPGTRGNITAAISGATIGDPATTSPPVPASPKISSPVTQAPAVQQTSAAPASQPASGFAPATIAIVGVFVLVLLIGSGFLIRRWWIRRQNPALFRRYD